ncbi:hypothetical protein K435DRAFT_61670 [Dendrothele bispora CBS 962.96]|uniref:Uncharacterized protein n=1 Tax=Dendrothele bispora (strain CBS 962.96) TaxID=1314807 RepID=A0A4S8MRT8_DENBC|nr:hypothetical protein K435DRAFT_61670 [Dendrothele bispora CBS 962.96]
MYLLRKSSPTYLIRHSWRLLLFQQTRSRYRLRLTLGLLTFVLLLLALLIFLICRQTPYDNGVLSHKNGREMISVLQRISGGYGVAFASRVGARVGGAGAMVVGKLPSSDLEDQRRGERFRILSQCFTAIPDPPSYACFPPSFDPLAGPLPCCMPLRRIARGPVLIPISIWDTLIC